MSGPASDEIEPCIYCADYEEGGASQERERIIEIIERCPRTDNDRTIDAPMLIELIKGENK